MIELREKEAATTRDRDIGKGEKEEKVQGPNMQLSDLTLLGFYGTDEGLSLFFQLVEVMLQYTSGDASKIMSFIPILNGLELQQPASSVFRSCLPKRRKATAMHEKCSKLTQIAEKSLEEGNFYHGIEACNELLDGYGRDIGPILRHDCLCTRAALLLKRNWKNDAHMAIRDCYNALKIDNSSFRAHYYMSEALPQVSAGASMVDRIH